MSSIIFLRLKMVNTRRRNQPTKRAHRHTHFPFYRYHISKTVLYSTIIYAQNTTLNYSLSVKSKYFLLSASVSMEILIQLIKNQNFFHLAILETINIFIHCFTAIYRRKSVDSRRYFFFQFSSFPSVTHIYNCQITFLRW